MTPQSYAVGIRLDYASMSRAPKSPVTSRSITWPRLRAMLQWSRAPKSPVTVLLALLPGDLHLASMEPGSEEPGDSSCRGTKKRRCTCFNGAGSEEPGDPVEPLADEPTPAASMEPGSEEPGDLRQPPGRLWRARCFNGAGLRRAR